LRSPPIKKFKVKKINLKNCFIQADRVKLLFLLLIKTNRTQRVTGYILIKEEYS
jgi:hypothetical protein